MAQPVKIVASGGIPIINAEGGPLLTPIDDPLQPGAGPFQIVLSGAPKFTLVNADGTAWTPPP